MKQSLLLLLIIVVPSCLFAQETKLNASLAQRLAQLPLHCITQEFPNKTGHSADGPEDARLLPSELHPAFYGCFDWHSSVHGHWMLVKLLKDFPELPIRDSIIKVLDARLTKANLDAEALYFEQYSVASTFERTYGWAWLLQLDQELLTWDHPLGKRWHLNMQTLSHKIVSLWKDYLPKQTYPNRTGVHPNTAFGLCFALDWACAAGDTAFQSMIEQKALYFYADNKAIPAHLEPDGSDFFSPSLQAAALMSRILPQASFVKWLDDYYLPEGIERIMKLPIVSDRNDYQIVHLDGLCFSRAWCMQAIAAKLPAKHQLKDTFRTRAQYFTEQALSELFNSNYGGGHWLASFAVYALSSK